MKFGYLAVILAAANIASANAESYANSKKYNNWMYSIYYTPAVHVVPRSYDEISNVVKDWEHFPSPVRAIGNLHSTTECVVNNGGTQIDMTVFKGINFKNEARTHVTVQAGVTLLEMHEWLDSFGLECMVSPEIGDATVGSITTSLTKDAALNEAGGIAKGSFYEVVDGVLYIDSEGNMKRLNREENPTELALFKCTDSLQGIVLEVDVRIRPQRLVTYMTNAVQWHEVAEKLPQWLSQGNVWISMTGDSAVVDRRVYAQPGQKHNNMFNHEAFQRGRYIGFLRAIHPRIVDELADVHEAVIEPIADDFAIMNFLNQTVYRWEYTNHYPSSKMLTPFRRLDFTWFEYPLERFDEIVNAYIAFVHEYKERTGFEASAGNAIYFVERIPEKPFGWFSNTGKGFEKPGISFTLDPAHYSPNDPQWHDYLRACNEFAMKWGGRSALTQTRFITREQYLAAPGNQPVMPAANNRFTTEFFAQFLAPEQRRNLKRRMFGL